MITLWHHNKFVVQFGDLLIEVTGFNFFIGTPIKNKKKLKENVQTGLYKIVYNWLTHMPHHSSKG